MICYLLYAHWCQHCEIRECGEVGSRQREIRPVDTNRERYSAIDMVMRTTADDVGPIASVVLSTREVRTHIRGNKGQLRDTRHHCLA